LVLKDIGLTKDNAVQLATAFSSNSKLGIKSLDISGNAIEVTPPLFLVTITGQRNASNCQFFSKLFCGSRISQFFFLSNWRNWGTGIDEGSFIYNIMEEKALERNDTILYSLKSLSMAGCKMDSNEASKAFGSFFAKTISLKVLP
jgi:hypothetical protein